MTQHTDIDWRVRAETAEARVAELTAERARLWEENARLRAERREVEYYEQMARGMETSLSWQITAPLRLFKRLAPKVRRKLRRP
ncbi:MAG TPA: hypothetical protein VNS09_12595 [Solirubrobacter sp.]|nr:hypothetical protein [Solirubrobacter sp.]